MCDNCDKLQKQIGHANNYNVALLDELGKLCKVAGIKSKNVAKLDAIAAIKEVTKAFKLAVDTALAKALAQKEATEDEATLESLPDAWQQDDSLEWLKETTLDPQQIDNMVELFELIGFTPHRLQFVLTSADMALALHHC
jgi:hypothetical protein